jgi:hypothetical protein
MAHTTFTKATARAKVGQRVRSRMAFAGIPRGAMGTVMRADRVIDGYELEVAWVWPGRPTPWIDWVTRVEYEAYLIELRAPRGGRPPAAPVGS